MIAYFHLDFFGAVFLLFMLHYLGDFALQSDFLANAKNPNTEIGKIFWKHALTAHSAIHALLVFLATGSIELACVEFASHFGTDLYKCNGRITLKQDQLIHLGTKVFILVLYFFLFKA